MARLLALDWDNNDFYLVAANVGRGKVHIERAISWQEALPFTAANAEQLGAKLRDQLKQADIAPAPIVIGLGRDRLVVKEVRFPKVPSDVEAAVVRNQIIKELTEAPDDVFLDYAPMTEQSKVGERRALSVVVRKDVINILQTVCRTAGLKLLAVTARPFGVAACYKHLAGATPHVPPPPSADAVSGVLTVTPRWAEFCAVRNQQLLFARSLEVGDGLLGEVRRNLAAYSGQPQLTFPRDAIQALYVCGNGENAVLREKLQETLGIPVHGLDPFAKEERIAVDAGSRAGFTGAVGLLHLWSHDGAMPVNFVKPRESKKAASPNKRKALVYSAVGALALVVAAYGAFNFVGTKRAELAKVSADNADLESELRVLKPKIEYLDALNEFNDGAIPWIDELYDLAARSPYEKGFRIKQVSVNPYAPASATTGAASKKNKRGAAAYMEISGNVDGSKVSLVGHFVDALNKDPHYSCNVVSITDKKAKDSTAMTEDFKLKVDISRQPASKYTARLVPPKLTKSQGAEDD